MAHKMNPGFKPSPNGSGIFGLPHHIEYGDILVIHIYIYNTCSYPYIYIYTHHCPIIFLMCVYIYIFTFIDTYGIKYIW